MNALIGLPKPGSWLDVDLTDEIAVAMRSFGASGRQLMEVNTQNPIAACNELQRLGAKSDLLRFVGSLGDTLDGNEVLQMLRRWNREETK